MIKSDKLFNATNSLIIGILLIISGIVVLWGRDKLYVDLINVFIIALLFLALKQFVSYFTGKKKHKNLNFTKCFLNLLFCIIISFFKNIPISILPLIFGLYLLLNSVVKYINYYLLLIDKAHGKLTEFVLATIYLLFAIPIIFSPIKNLNVVLVIIGVYIILLGSNYVIDFISFIIPKRLKNKIKRSIRISLPTIFEAVIPYAVLREINYHIDKENYEKSFIIENKQDINCDVEIFVHVAPSGYNRFGHVDLCVDGTVISYGAYDFSTSKLFNMIGEGMIFKVEREKYIKFCTEYSNKTLFCFGLKLTNNQRKKIDKHISQIVDNTTYFETPYEKIKGTKKSKKKKKLDDYPSRLFKKADAKFYKVNSGKFKTFFVLGNNCTKMVDNIIGKSGIDLFKMNGIITPGAYYEYLNREYQKKNSMVASKKIYNNKQKAKKSFKDTIKQFST